MADRDFVVKNGLVTGSNNATFGTAVTLASNGNVGIETSTPSEKLSVTGNITATGSITATNLTGTVQTATQGTINHNSLSNYVADQHVAHSSVSISAGNGLTGGGTIAANRTLSVLAGTGIASNTSGVHVTNVPSSVTFNNGGSGAASGSTFNGNSPITVSYNTLGAPSTTGTNASGTWGISITGGIESTTPSLGYSASGSNIDLNGQGGPQVRGQSSGAAMMSFHRPGSYAINFGLGTDNQLRTGGWSRGGNHVILDSGNYNSYAPTLTGGNASGTWGISITGSAASLGGVAASSYVRNDISSRQTGGVTRLFRNDGGDNYSVQIYWTGSRWRLYGYLNDAGHADTHVGFADSATNATNATNATLATKASTLSQSGGNGSAMTFFWSGQSGQPTWLWGGNDGVNHYVYNPSNFSVAYATSAGSASTFTSTSQNSQFNSIGIGTGASGTAGEIRATNNITAYYSDRRLKENIKKIENPLEKILKINGVTYNSNDLAAYFGYNDRSVQVGVIAQEIQQVLPMAVKHAPFDIATKHGVEYSKSGENYLTVQYEKIIPLLIEAIKELSSEVESLKNKLGDK